MIGGCQMDKLYQGQTTRYSSSWSKTPDQSTTSQIHPEININQEREKMTGIKMTKTRKSFWSEGDVEERLPLLRPQSRSISSFFQNDLSKISFCQF